MPTVGVIVNPLAGKDIRRLVANASPVSDSAKIGAVRRVVAGALEAGAERVLVAGDHHRLGERAVRGLTAPGDKRVEILTDHVRGGREDTVAATERLAKEDTDVVVVLGGDGTHRDVAGAWPDATLVTMSTGTNNVFPDTADATSAGVAAGLVACGVVPRPDAVRRCNLLRLELPAGGHDVALVEVALVDGAFVGSRAVWDASRVREVVAAIATPASTGLSSIAGRALPVERGGSAAAHVRLATADDGDAIGPGHRALRVPLSPGTFSTVIVEHAATIGAGDIVTLHGPGVLALDGERTHVLRRPDAVAVRLDPDGPAVVDVVGVLTAAARAGRFDAPAPHPPTAPGTPTDPEEDPHGH